MQPDTGCYGASLRAWCAAGVLSVLPSRAQYMCLISVTKVHQRQSWDQNAGAPGSGSSTGACFPSDPTPPCQPGSVCPWPQTCLSGATLLLAVLDVSQPQASGGCICRNCVLPNQREVAPVDHPPPCPRSDVHPAPVPKASKSSTGLSRTRTRFCSCVMGRPATAHSNQRCVAPYGGSRVVRKDLSRRSEGAQEGLLEERVVEEERGVQEVECCSEREDSPRS